MARKITASLLPVLLASCALLLSACTAREPVAPTDVDSEGLPLGAVEEMDGRSASHDGAFLHLLTDLDYSTLSSTCRERGDQAFDGGDISTAIALYEEAFDRGAVDASLLTRLGWCYQPRNPGRAIECYDLAIEIKADQWDAHFNRANAYFQLGHIHDRKVRTMSGPFDYAATDGNVEVEHGAIYHYNDLIARQEDAGVPVFPLTRYNSGHCFYLGGSYAQARRSYIAFYENGGAATKFAARALAWIDYLENELSLPQDFRYQPAPGQ